MFDRRFFASKLGLSALLSVAAMVSFNVYVFAQQVGMTPPTTVAAPAQVELA